ncbi:MAG: hypothetical protein M0037_01540 [Betaproteobacteria bacterium]|nr:hypothetical protein [Betaproteobacteria bacterium]
MTTPRPQTVETLCGTIREMDERQRKGFVEILALATLSLSVLSAPEAALHIEDVAVALRFIRNTATAAENDLENLADEVGCQGHQEG